MDKAAQPPENIASRRRFLGLAALGAGALALPGCASMGPFSYTEAIRRLLTVASQDAFEQLLAPNGFYDTQLAQLTANDLLGNRSSAVARILGSGLVRDRLMREFNQVAAEGAYRAAPVVADTIRVIGFQNAIDLVTGGPTAATSFLRQNMGQQLLEVMLPEIGDALSVVNDPVLGPALSELAGVNLQGVANSLTRNTEEVIWNAMGEAEARIRQDPYATDDPLLIGAFGTQGAVR